MKALAIKIFGFLRSRLALNIYFWLMALIMLYNNVRQHVDYPTKVYVFFISINLMLMMALVYLNNLWLVPKLLARKKRFFYFISIFTLTFFFAAIYHGIQKYIVIHYPKIDIYQISFISAPVSRSWNFSTVNDELTTFFFGFLILVFIFTALWFMHDYARQQRASHEAAKKQTETELSFLKSQLNPHFLFNTLNNLYGLSLTKSDDAPLAILKLSALMRYMLYESNVAVVEFEKEKEAMEAYIDLELLRMDKKTDLHVEIEADKNYMIPPLLWLPVLENVFKHGTRVIAESYLLGFRFVIKNNKLEIASQNYFKNNMAKDGGIGLANLRKRLAILFPGKHEIDTFEADGLYNVSIKISLS